MNDNNGKPCNCISDLIVQSKRNHVQFQGLAIAYKPDGSSVAGLMMIRPPILVGGRKRIAIMGFRFCPFCGARISPNVEHVEEVAE